MVSGCGRELWPDKSNVPPDEGYKPGVGLAVRVAGWLGTLGS